MKLTKENVCVFIEDKQQLEQAISVLDKYNELHSLFEDSMLLEFKGTKYNFLRFLSHTRSWFMGKGQYDFTKITITELEKILKDGKEN